MYQCPCCGNFTLTECPPGSYEICSICGWEDDEYQYNNPDCGGGANILSLNEVREKYLEEIRKVYSISKEIIEEAYKNNIKVRLVDEEVYKEIQIKIKDKFLDSKYYPTLFLWEDLRNFKSITDAKGWSYIKDFVKDNECIMFFNLREDKKAFYIENGEQLNTILGETTGYEFYITNELVEYLICFTHHDELIGCGTAGEWAIFHKNNECY